MSGKARERAGVSEYLKGFAKKRKINVIYLREC